MHTHVARKAGASSSSPSLSGQPQAGIGLISGASLGPAARQHWIEGVG